MTASTPTHTRQALVFAIWLFAALSPMSSEASGYRKTSSSDYKIPLERLTLKNGLRVLMSPEPTASSVLIDATFRAGAIFEPPGRSGLAHYTEHIVAGGPKSGPRYIELLESRGARATNAFTSIDRMAFRSIVPPQEVPLLLWVIADRMAGLSDKLTPEELPRHVAVVEAERSLATKDVPYGSLHRVLFERTFPAPHPLNQGLFGSPEELSSTRLQDVRAFMAQYLVPANCIITIVGNFEPKIMARRLKETLGGIAPGQRAPDPEFPAASGRSSVLKVVETTARRPRVSKRWRLPDYGEPTIRALELGALFLSLYGAFGTQLHAHFERHLGGSLFELDMTLPYDKPIKAAHREVDGWSRFLTHTEAPPHLVRAVYLALDRGRMLQLENLEGRADALTETEFYEGNAQKTSKSLQKHWKIPARSIQVTARSALSGGSLTIHSRPTDPIQPKVWDEDEDEEYEEDDQ